MNDYLLYARLNIQSKYNFYKTWLISKLFNIQNITILKNNILQNVTTRFYLIRILNYIIYSLQYIRDYYDVKCSKIQASVITLNKNKVYIMDSEQMDTNDINLNDMYNLIINNDDTKSQVNDKIYVKLEIEDNGKKICLKKLVNIYMDKHKIYHHTINNIMLFNQLEFSSDSKLHLEYFDDGNFKRNILNLKDITHKHITNLTDE